MQAAPSASTPSREPVRPCVFWLGPGGGAEFKLARDRMAGRLDVVAHRSVQEAVEWETSPEGRRPALVVLAADRPGRWPPAAALAVVRQWPLAVLVTAATSLADGRRRSGPVLAGVEEVAWHELPERLECWLDERGAGQAGGLAVPATARREERLLESLDALLAIGHAGGGAVALAGGRNADVEGLADLLALAGRRIVGATIGRPPLDTTGPLLVWDAVTIWPDDLAWLRMLAANRPGLGIVLLESFPRGEVAAAALRAGAGAVLGRPVTLETLEGTLRRLERGGRESLG